MSEGSARVSGRYKGGEGLGEGEEERQRKKGGEWMETWIGQGGLSKEREEGKTRDFFFLFICLPVSQ